MGHVIPALDDLLETKTRDELETQLISALRSEGYVGTDWNVGSVARTIVRMIETAVLDQAKLVRLVTAGGFLDLAAELVDEDGNAIEGWAEALAKYAYDCDRAAATYTIQNCKLACELGTGPYTRDAGELIAWNPVTGHRYVLNETVTVPDGSSVTAAFRAESPGSAYLDGPDTITQLVTPLPGLTITNEATTFSEDTTDETGTGTIALSCAGTPTPARSWELRITKDGDVGAGEFELDVWVGRVKTTLGPIAPIPATYTQGDVTFTFTDGASGISFVAPSSHNWSAPGSPVVQAGTDEESITALVERCRNQWAALSLVPTNGRFGYWISECSRENSFGITKVQIRPSEVVAGQTDIYVATNAGAPSGPTIQTLQSYIDDRLDDVDRAFVQACSTLQVTISGTVTVRRGTLAAVQAAADTNWATYIAGLPVGGESVGTVRGVILAQLSNALMSAGAKNVAGLALNAVAQDLAMNDDDVAVQHPTANQGTPSSALTWQEVA